MEEDTLFSTLFSTNKRLCLDKNTLNKMSETKDKVTNLYKKWHATRAGYCWRPVYKTISQKSYVFQFRKIDWNFHFHYEENKNNNEGSCKNIKMSFDKKCAFKMNAENIAKSWSAISMINTIKTKVLRKKLNIFYLAPLSCYSRDTRSITLFDVQLCFLCVHPSISITMLEESGD